MGSVSWSIRAISEPVHQPFKATVTAPKAVAAQKDKTYSMRLAAATATRSPLPMPYSFRNACAMAATGAMIDWKVRERSGKTT